MPCSIAPRLTAHESLNTSVLKRIEAEGWEYDDRESEHSRKWLNLEPETGSLLSLLLKLSRVHNVLEIGTSTGYSTICIASVLQEQGGRVTTIGRDTPMNKFIGNPAFSAQNDGTMMRHLGESRRSGCALPRSPRNRQIVYSVISALPLVLRSAASIWALTLAWATSAVTRMPFMMARSLELPWPMAQTPRTPRSGAPP